MPDAPGFDPIVLAIPVFFAAIGAEALAWRRRRALAGAPSDYRLDDTLTNLGCGAGQQVLGVFLLGAMVWAYEGVRSRMGLFELTSGSWAVWAFALLAADFLYYWFHRISHEVSFLWAAHKVHHQSEHYNLGVALRQSWLQQCYSFFFYLPLAVVGVPTSVFLTVVGLDTLYQFWIHTQLVDRIGPLEQVLNTPSHHRVHHGVDPEHLDRNHAGLLIVWDKLFGTFTPERSTPRYGTVEPIRSMNPVWVNVEPYVELWHRARARRTWSDRLRVFFAGPGWRAADEAPPPGPLRTDPGYSLYEAPASRGRRTYAAVQFVVVLASVLLLLTLGRDLPLVARGAAGTWVLLSFGTIGGLLELRPWAVPAEVARWVAAAGGVAWALIAGG